MQDDTIIAISTPLGFGGLGVVRLSGPNALSIAGKIYTPKIPVQTYPPRKALLGSLHDADKKAAIDEVYLIYFPGPKTYTREDMVEFSCHGSPVILEEAVRLGIEAGARLAEPGEFTLRAFLGGRIDMLQAEAVGDMIHARSLGQARIAFSQMEGKLSQKIQTLRSALVHLLSQMEAGIEFPDEGLHLSKKIVRNTLDDVLKKIRALILSHDTAKSLEEGISLAITGKTNVGKSTLFNKLLDRERAIVTPYPGTTRDYLAEKFRLSDSFFTLIDTAGFNQDSRPVEKEGIKRGRRLSAEADGILLILDASRQLEEEDLSLIRKYRKKKTLIILNKIDLPPALNRDALEKLVEGMSVIEVSALKGTHLNVLKDAIQNTFSRDFERDQDMILHLRQKLILEKVRDNLSEAKKRLAEGYSEEIAAEEIKNALPLFGRLTGEIRTEEVLQDIFSRFCVGK